MCQDMCPTTSPPKHHWEGKLLQINFKLDDAPRGERFRTQCPVVYSVHRRRGSFFLCSRPVHAVRDDTGASWPVTPPDVLRADQHVSFSLLPHLVVPFHLQDETPFLL